MRIDVERPDIDGETVRFRWNQSEPNPLQRRNAFYFRYPGIDLARFSNGLVYEIFLGLQLKVFAGLAPRVEVFFPEPLAKSTVDYWRAFHNALDVRIEPVVDTVRYETLRAGKTPDVPGIRSAVYFGGGKDSMLTACLFAEIFGQDRVLLIQYVAPLTRDKQQALWLERRQSELMLRPAREVLGFATQTVQTDYQANFTPLGRRFRPHIELYTVGALPVLIARKVSVSAFAYARIDYPILAREDGTRRYAFSRSRPEVLETQSLHYRRALGFDHTLTNILFMFSSLMGIRILIERYPQALAQIVMCSKPGIETRWCHECGKCFSYALFTLRWGYVDPDFDYDAAFTRSDNIIRWVKFAESEAEIPTGDNAPWTSGIMHPAVVPAVCQAVARTDYRVLKGKIGAEAEANILIMQALFGNRTFPNTELIADDVVDFLDSDLARRVGAIVSEYFPRVERFPAPWIYGDREAVIDFQTRMPTPTAAVPHIAAIESARRDESQ